MQQFSDEALPVVVDLAEKLRLRRERAPAPRESAPAVRCQKCQDRGYLRANVPYGHPQFGRALECECKKAQKKEAHRQRLWEQSNLDRLAGFRDATFDSFQFWLPGVQAGYEAALAFTDAQAGWLVLQGTNGCGKTHLAVAVARKCLDNGQAVLFGVVPDLLDDLRSTFDDDGEESYKQAYRKIRDAEVLILDDLGAESSTSWATEKLYQLVNYRYNARTQTVITTNNVNLARIDERIATRLRDRHLARTVVMNAQNFRELEDQS